MNKLGAPGDPRGVLLLTELFPPDQGGSAVLLGNIYRRLEQAVTVIRHAPDRTVLETVEGRLRVVRIAMTGGHWGVTSLQSLRRYRRMMARIATECRRRPAIVHCGRALPEGLAALGASALGGGRYVCWTHGEELQYAKSSRELTFLQRRVHRGAAALLANSRNTARELEALGVPSHKVHVVHPGVDAERFARAEAGRAVRARYAPNGELLLVTVGRLQRRKGHDLVIESLASAGLRLPAWRYVIAGDGEERARLERLADLSGVRERVVFAGAVPGDELPGYYAAADIFVHPNRVDAGDVEGFGIVFLEAAAAGVAVIGGSTGGVPEAVEEGVTGLLVDGTDPAELVAAIGTLASSPELRRRMGEAGRQRVRQHFTWERAAAQVSALQRQIATE